MGDFSKDINSKFPNNKVKALLNIVYTANWLNSQQNAFLSLLGYHHNNITFLEF